MAKARIKKRLSNTEFVNHFMSFGSPMNQLFVMDAIGKLSKLVVDSKDQLMISMDNGFITPESWIKAAEDWRKQYAENYEQ
jgi:hypothetical protein